MTANNQAFVKAFARRNRNADTNSSHQQNQSGVETKSPSPAPATWWIDETDDQKIRADHDTAEHVPAPHFATDIRVTNLRDEIAAESEDAMESFPEPESAPIPNANVLASLQHTITSFASESYTGTSDIIGGGFTPFVARELDESTVKPTAVPKPETAAKPATAKATTRTAIPAAKLPAAVPPTAKPPATTAAVAKASAAAMPAAAATVKTPPVPEAKIRSETKPRSEAKSASHEASIIELQRILSSKTAAARTTSQRENQTGTSAIPSQPQAAEMLPPSAAATLAAAMPAANTIPAADPVEVVETSPSPTPAAAPAVAAKLKAAWEVDQFDVPSNVAKLFFEGELFQMVAEQMLGAVQTGLDSVLVTSVHPEEGRSTVATGVAMAAAAAGIRVALVDADLVTPTLVDELSLDVEYGWLDALRGGLSLGEIAVHAVEDHVTLFPLFPSEPSGQATAAEIAKLIQTLKENFDLVIIDGPLGNTPVARSIASLVESAMIVRDIENTTNEEINALSNQLLESGIQGIGVVDNFA